MKQPFVVKFAITDNEEIDLDDWYAMTYTNDDFRLARLNSSIFKLLSGTDIVDTKESTPLLPQFKEWAGNK